MACARQDSTVLCRLFGLPDPGPPIKIPTRRTASDPVVGGMSRSQQLDSGLQDRRPLRISKITQNSDPHSRQFFPKRLWRAGENQVAALIFPLAASKQLRRALTIRYRDSSVDSNIPGLASIKAAPRANVASIIIRFYIDAGKPSKGLESKE